MNHDSGTTARTIASRSWRRTMRPAPGGSGYADLWRLAARDVASMSSGIVTFGLMLGVTVQHYGRDPSATLLGAGTIYAGSAQLASATLLHHGSALWLAVISGVIVNLRLLLYSAAIGDRFAGHPRMFRWLAPHTIIDQTFLVSEMRRELVGLSFRRYWLCLGAFVLMVWTGSVASGLLLAPALPALPHLALGGTAMFIGMMVPRLVTRPAWAAAVVGGAVAGLVTTIAPTFGILTGTVAGVLAGVAQTGTPDAAGQPTEIGPEQP